MQITHLEAQRLIQYDLDRALDSEKQSILFAHLQVCDVCRSYADGMLTIENSLRHVMNKEWKHRPLPLSIDMIKSKKSTHYVIQFRTALVSVLVAVFSFFIWQMTATLPDSSGQITSNILPVPTPSIQLSTASIVAPKCSKWSLHKVDDLDTLESIAFQYSVSIEAIMTFNNMTSDEIYESMELKIPQCDVTPTVTAHMPTRTLTPRLESTMTTQGDAADRGDFH